VDAVPAAHALAGRPDLLGAVAQLGCLLPTLIESKLNYKQRFPRAPAIPGLHTRPAADQWPLHHDWGYYRQQGYPPVALTVAISLDDCAGRGPMVVVPGSHRMGSRLLAGDADSGTGRVAEDSIGTVRTAIHAPPGAALFFHCMLVHSSPPNPGSAPRRILHLTYAPEFADGTAAYRRNGRWQEHAARFDDRYRKLAAAANGTAVFRIREEGSP
jgi:ectoine hydroxylase-related dioxygenase (phytanoyl-CoA dioxygenase family)